MRPRSWRSSMARVARRLGVACLVLVAIGCSEALGPEEDDLVAARARWVAAGAADYLFEFQRSCFCGPDFLRAVRIEVLAGTVSSATYVDTGTPITEPLSSVPTIEALFDEIDEAIDGGAFSLTAEYDPGLGYPISVSIDFIENAIDDEMAFAVGSFQLLDVSGSQAAGPVARARSPK